MSGRDVTGVILAAGRSTRMRPFSARYPKPILPVCNRPLIEYQIEAMKRLGITDIVVVVGYLGYEITLALGDGRHLGVRLRYVEQRETMGIAHAVGQLESYIRGPFLLFLGDIFFRAPELQEMLTVMASGADAVLAIREDESPEAIGRNFAVLTDDRGNVRRVIEKPRHPPNKSKGCGLYLFDPRVFDAIRRTPRTAARDEYEITDAIQIFIDDGFVVRTADVVTYDINVTFPADLLTCNLVQLGVLGQERMIGAECQIHPDARIVNSVVADRVVVEHPIEIRDSLVFPGVTVAHKLPLRRMIVTADEVIDCRFPDR